ncbi:MAG: preprotein translocase subunit SecE [Microgenomates group bacterium]
MLINFLKEAKSELNNVSWPSKEETVRLTAIVIFISVLVGLFIGIFDYLFTNLFTLIIK